MLRSLLLSLAFLGGVERAWAATFMEDFSSNPAAQGWEVVGESNLFRWNAASEKLEVTWDSGQTNSYFRKPLGTILSKRENFSLGFDLYLNDIAVGVRPSKTFTFELAVGLHNSKSAMNQNFLRGTGNQSPNLVEFNYFPDSGFGATVWPAFIATNGATYFNWEDPNGSYTILPLPTRVWMRVTMNYLGESGTLNTTITTNGQAIGAVNSIHILTNFTDYRVDMFSITSYSDQGAGGSLLAHGWVDNVRVTVPDPPMDLVKGQFEDSSWSVDFNSQTNWIYALERTADFQTWLPASQAKTSGGGAFSLTVTNPVQGSWFYRVRAEKP